MAVRLVPNFSKVFEVFLSISILEGCFKPHNGFRGTQDIVVSGVEAKNGYFHLEVCHAR